MNKFISIEPEGQLFFDKIIFETYIPILFVCTNEQKELFLCICCQDNEKGKKWLISRTSPSMIVDMLKDKITIRDTLLNEEAVRVSADLIDGKLNIERNNSDWNEESIFLPKKGAYIDAEPEEYNEEIEYYSNKKAINYWSKSYESMVSTLTEIGKMVLPVAEMVDTAIMDAFSNVITSEVMQTIKEIDKMYFKLENQHGIDFTRIYESVIDEEIKVKDSNIEVEIDEEAIAFFDAA